MADRIGQVVVFGGEGQQRVSSERGKKEKKKSAGKPSTPSEKAITFF
jgi:hypothetical protein